MAGVIGAWQALTEREQSRGGPGPPVPPEFRHALALQQSRRRRKGYAWPAAIGRAKALGPQPTSETSTRCTDTAHTLDASPDPRQIFGRALLLAEKSLNNF